MGGWGGGGQAPVIEGPQILLLDIQESGMLFLHRCTGAVECAAHDLHDTDGELRT